jgi:hypothetical protein
MLRADVPFMARRISGRAKVQPSASRSGKQKVHVIGHDDYGVKMNRLAMVVQAMLQRECTSFRRELSCGLRAESYK